MAEGVDNSLSIQSVDPSRGKPSPVERPEPPEKADAPKISDQSVTEEISDKSARASDAVRSTAETISPEKLGQLIRELEEQLPTTSSKGLRFQMDETLNRPIVSVVDKESGQVLRQLPTEEVVRAARNIDYMRGILFDDYT